MKTVTVSSMAIVRHHCSSGAAGRSPSTAFCVHATRPELLESEGLHMPQVARPQVNSKSPVWGKVIFVKSSKSAEVREQNYTPKGCIATHDSSSFVLDWKCPQQGDSEQRHLLKVTCQRSKGVFGTLPQNLQNNFPRPQLREVSCN